MNAQTYVSGNLALTVDSHCDGKLIVIDGGCAHANDGEIEKDCKSLNTSAHSSSLIRLTASILVCALLFLGAYQISYSVAAPVNEIIENANLQSIRIKQGETLWNLAETYCVDGVSTRDMVSAIREWNDLDSSMLHPGQKLLVADPS